MIEALTAFGAAHPGLCAIPAGFLMDLCLGDPETLPHPVRLIGSFIDRLEHFLYISDNREHLRERQFFRGLALALIVPSVSAGTAAVLLKLAYRLSPIAGFLLESVMCWQILALKSLRDASMKVWKALDEKDLPRAREAVSMIVGRDTDRLDETGVTKAAVETVAENASDGVIAPLFFLCLGGPAAGWFYKAVNTMDSMIGYRNTRYLYFGRAAARFDDALNYVPARLSALLMIAGAALSGHDPRAAFRIWRRDRRNHKSPNSAQTESVMAGALGIRLAGDASYFGVVLKKPFIGDDTRAPEPEDIRRANRILYRTAALSFLLFFGARAAAELLLAGMAGPGGIIAG